jgi:DNA helicase-2/ATP-dependent DNA helicase PcrA
LHSKFGNGVIENIEGVQPNVMASINFVGFGEKKLLLKFAKLQVL